MSIGILTKPYTVRNNHQLFGFNLEVGEGILLDQVEKKKFLITNHNMTMSKQR